MDNVLNNNTLAEYIYDNNIDFVAIITTPWHLIGLKYILKSELINKYTHGVVLIAEHEISGACLNVNEVKKALNISAHYFQYKYTEDDVSNLFTGVKKLFTSTSTKKIKILSSDKPWIRLALILEKYSSYDFEFFVYDEGIGSYFKDDVDYYDGIHKVNFYLKKYIKKILTYKYQIISKKLFIKSGNNLVKNQSVINAYKEIIFKGKVFPLMDVYDSKYVLINTQTYHDNGEILHDADLRVLDSVIYILKKAAFKIKLKPHPRDKSTMRYSQLGLEIIDPSISQEEYISSLKEKPIFIIGFTTTTLITLPLFYGMKAISLVNFIDQRNITGNAKKDFLLFSKLFKNMVLMPSNYLEFKEFLK